MIRLMFLFVVMFLLWVLSGGDFIESDRDCIIEAIKYEGRGESMEGQELIAWVILNRAEQKGISACEVISEPEQFTYKKRRLYPIHEKGVEERASEAADNVIASFWEHTENATHYNHVREGVKWGGTDVKQVGNHLFYIGH